MSRDLESGTDKVLSFTEHLEELRWRIIACIASFIIILVAAFGFSPRVVEFLIQPLATQPEASPDEVITFQIDDTGTLRLAGSAADARDLATSLTASRRPVSVAIDLTSATPPIILSARHRSSLYFLSPVEPFTLLIKAAILVGIIFSIPVVAYNIWRFVAPGLLARERKVVGPVILSSLILFPLGAAFAYYIAGLALRVLLGFSDQIPGLEPNIVASKYLSFIMTLMIVFGTFFEFPLVLVLLSRIGAIDARFLSEKRKYAILVIAVVAAVATPTPDPFTMLALALPLVVLYEGALVVIRMLEHVGRKPGEADSV